MDQTKDRPSVRIGFDARMAGFRHAGIGRYTEELLRQLIERKTIESAGKKKKIQWVVFLSPDSSLEWLKQKATEKNSFIELQETSIRHYSLLEQLWLWKVFSDQNLEILHIPHFNVPLFYLKKYVVTIHDLLWHTHRDPRATTLPQWLYWLKYGFYRLVTWSAIARAVTVLVPTKAVKEEVTELEGRKQGVTITKEGLSAPYKDGKIAPANFAQKKIAQPYVVYTGSLYPHKNVETILKVLRQMPELRLKVASSRNIFTEHFEKMAEEYSVRNQVDVLGYVPDNELITLYQKSVAAVQPSLAEGFGLTGLEAMSVGCPIVVSDIPVFHEVYQEQARFVKARDVFGWVEALSTLQKNPPSFADRQKLQDFAQSYTWEKSVDLTFAAYEKILSV